MCPYTGALEAELGREIERLRTVQESGGEMDEDDWGMEGDEEEEEEEEEEEVSGWVVDWCSLSVDDGLAMCCIILMHALHEEESWVNDSLIDAALSSRCSYPFLLRKMQEDEDEEEVLVDWPEEEEAEDWSALEADGWISMDAILVRVCVCWCLCA